MSTNELEKQNLAFNDFEISQRSEHLIYFLSEDESSKYHMNYISIEKKYSKSHVGNEVRVTRRYVKAYLNIIIQNAKSLLGPNYKDHVEEIRRCPYLFIPKMR